MLAGLISGLVSGEALAALRRARTAAIAYLVAAVFGLAGAVFLLVAAYIAAARHLGDVYAALIFGGVFILIAVLVIVASRIAGRRAVMRATKKRNREISRIAVTTGLALLPTLMKGRVGKAALIAPVIAAVIYGIYRENAAPGDEDPHD